MEYICWRVICLDTITFCWFGCVSGTFSPLTNISALQIESSLVLSQDLNSLYAKASFIFCNPLHS